MGAGRGGVTAAPARRAVCAVSLHPTRDVVLEGPALRLGGVNRADRWFAYPGGKALNAARTAGMLGGPARAVVLAPAGWGETLTAFLGRYDVAFTHLACPGEGRVCVMLDEPRRETVVNTDLALTVDTRLRAAIARTVWREGRAAAFLVLAGSLPPRFTPRQVAGLFAVARSTGARLAVDQTGARLREALRFRPWIVKPNLQEFHAVLGRPTRRWADLQGAVDEVRARGAERVLLSLGDRGCLLAGPAGRWFAPALRAPEPASPLGCGDALFGAFLRSVAAGAEEPEALRWGVAAATANLGRRGACLMTRAEIAAVYPKVRVRRV